MLDRFGVAHFLIYVLGEHLAKLDAPLVEAVDVPYGSLDEYLVFVERDQLAERIRRELGQEQ
jgi:hypothetical protein